MSRRCFLLVCWLSLSVGFSSLLKAQEKIRIDANTHRVVESPWELMPIQPPTDASFRGLQVVSDNIMWASGTGGTIVNTFDAGKNWRVLKISGAEELDVRDIHAIDEATVIAMTSGTPARIYRSTNAGISWKVVFESTDKRVFFDALTFINGQVGYVMGDPIQDQMVLLKTNDAGLTWKPVGSAPKLFNNEAGFAASGTNMTNLPSGKLLIGLGGGEPNKLFRSRVVMTDGDMKNWTAADVPLARSETAGIFSVHFTNEKNGVIVGGDYKKPDSLENNYALSQDGGKTWYVPKERKPPTGFRSCVATWLNGTEISFVTVGPSGTDLSTDLGKSWTRISNEGFNSVQFSPSGKSGWAVGGNGRVAKWLGRK